MQVEGKHWIKNNARYKRKSHILVVDRAAVLHELTVFDMLFSADKLYLRMQVEFAMIYFLLSGIDFFSTLRRQLHCALPPPPSISAVISTAMRICGISGEIDWMFDSLGAGARSKFMAFGIRTCSGISTRLRSA